MLQLEKHGKDCLVSYFDDSVECESWENKDTRQGHRNQEARERERATGEREIERVIDR